ncbi:methylmalonate-semialdehyde dehydrogenase (CoA acylating) [Corallococcus sp. H22C18031201]|uniref:CoA-acylating methylmalonate-semialdehyde dehydrogenase n=1 Tax=Citreicoccus inhibens TaxID=2849499 RepID=UPI000E72BB03|nr:CoA-acylating methylmalonate-semialdehyde dehydrogenase [Citreicoccus inhibens]MBU8898442.1 CoA-acylating methylmalonate-semialdehyde dehydrogenase [Citreicoccus inhibens]RJS21290.1 methylmalonate-semialdehyde dehydrogenase (CoA acylating) [Corallococcus sp. H22C18031201]
MSFVEFPESIITCRNLVGGEWLEPVGAMSLEVRSPYTGALIGRVPLTSASGVAQAVEAAKPGAAQWRATSLRERTQHLLRFRALLEAQAGRLAHLAAAEAGKTVAEARAGILKGLEVCDFALSLQNLDSGGHMEVSRGVTCEFRREPLGIVAGVTPFNFPAMVPMWLFPIAVTLGNAFILKPSEKVPLTACALGELMVEAGYPAGVFSVVHGGREAVDALVVHPDVQALAFVGSSSVARHLYSEGGKRGKRVLALGSAKNHLIVVPDADPSLTPQAVVDSFTGCAGQRCMAASVLLAVGEVQPLVDDIVQRAARLELGPGMGALIDRGAVDRLETAIARAREEGARVLLDGRGRRPAGEAWAGGNWLGPTILDGVSPEMEAARRELFGPVLSIIRVPTLSAALAVENASPYGNAASVFTTNGAVAQAVVEGARAGMVGVNVGVPVPREPFSFGGTGDSKFGHGDVTGPSSLDFWTQLKKVTRKWTARTDGSWMS